jgi:hypothetical protein
VKLLRVTAGEALQGFFGQLNEAQKEEIRQTVLEHWQMIM